MLTFQGFRADIVLTCVDFHDNQASGIPELDEIRFGDAHGTVGKFLLYELETPKQKEAVPKRSVDDLLKMLEETEYIPHVVRRQQNLVLIYNCKFDPEAAYHIIKNKFENTKAVYSIGVAEHHMIVYVNKQDTKSPPDNVDMLDDNGVIVKPRLFKFRVRGTGMLEELLVMMQNVMKYTVTNVAITMPTTGNYGFEQIVANVKQMSQEQIMMVKGRAMAKHWKVRTEFETVFLRVFRDLVSMREIQNRHQGLVFSAYDPPFGIVPMEHLINLKQKGSRLKEVVMEKEWYYLASLFSSPLIAKYGIVILGENTTTGYGKTQLALRLAVEWCKAYNQATGSPKEEAKIVFSNTLDVAREVVFRKGFCWVIDEMSPGDQDQLIHASENSMKVLMSPATQGSIRCRNQDLVLPCGVPRIVTGNAENVDDWVGRRMRWTEPLQRKSIVYQITMPLCHESWRQKGPAIIDEDSEQAARIMSEQMPRQPPSPPGLTSRLVGMLRGFLPGQ